MKRAGLQRAKRFLLVFSIVAGSFASGGTAIAAVNVGSGNCVQNVDAATGVEVATSGNYCYVAFKSGTRTWFLPTNVVNIDYLVLGGGGSGGSRHGAGGGAGGLVRGSNASTTGITSLSITVGDGASAPARIGSNNFINGVSGSNSLLAKDSGTGSFVTVTAYGGGGGTAGGIAAQNGGSGGGSQTATVSTPITGQGNSGGTGGYDGTYYYSGGGGGAGAVGGNGSGSGGGNGGAGDIWISSFTTTIASALNLNLDAGRQTSGNQVYFAGGGGGGITLTATPGSGGLGGGGAAVSGNNTGVSGLANSGGGGGASGCCEGGTAGAGGSGIVIIRYIWDVTAPTISTFSVTSASGSDNYYGLGDTITVTIVWSEAVTVTGTPRVPIQGLTSKYLGYYSGTGTNTLLLNYVVTNTDLDRDGFSISANTLELNSGTIRDQVGNNATLSHGAVSATIALRIDGIPPTLSNMSIPSSGITINMGFSETISSTISSYGQFTLMVGSVQNAVSAGVTADSRLTMNLSFGVVSGAVVTLTYTDPTTGNDANAIQDEAGNDLATFSNQAVSNLSTKTTNSSVSLALDPSSATAVYRAPTSVKATVTAAGKVSFFHNGRIVVACRNVATTVTSPFYATCSWKPSVQQSVSLKASYKSTTAGFTDSSSSDLRIYVTRRSGLR